MLTCKWCEALSRIFPNRAPLRGFEAPSTSWSAGKCQFFKMVRKIIQNRMKVEILILICQVMMNSVQFSARMNIEMTQKKLFEIFKRRVSKLKICILDGKWLQWCIWMNPAGKEHIDSYKFQPNCAAFRQESAEHLHSHTKCECHKSVWAGEKASEWFRKLDCELENSRQTKTDRQTDENSENSPH